MPRSKPLAAWMLVAGLMFGPAPRLHAAAPDWRDAQLSPDRRAALAAAAMTLDEKLALLKGSVAFRWIRDGAEVAIPAAAIPGAGFVPGVPRLGLPALYETDAGLGVSNPIGGRAGDVATALPSSLALASAFDPSLAYRAGAMVGSEARAKGFNVLLGGGMNLARDPRNGRNFEYLGEDPLLAGELAGAEVRGTQDQGVISTVKHFALNANETQRNSLDARIDREALRESDLLAFEIAVEQGHPGAVMCAYNLINSVYACGNRWLLVDVLKTDWHFPGWVMSDWGAVHAVGDAMNGLDQESGAQMDRSEYFGEPLRGAVADGSVPISRIDDMVHRILRTLFAVGVVDRPQPGQPIDYAAHAQIALDIARRGMVLLKNEAAVLPLTPASRSIAVIGGLANSGVLSGGGSAQVIPSNGPVIRIPLGGAAPNWRDEVYDPSSPYEAIQRAAAGGRVTYDSGEFAGRAAALAARSDVAVVFATRHEQEGYDIPDITLPDGQDALIDAVARANPSTVVVLEAGNPVAMPWLGRVAAVLMAWYPGQEGGQAIADVLFGKTDPSGRLPITLPRAAADFLRPTLPNLTADGDLPVSIDYGEGAAVGYRGYAQRGVAPLFAFGFGLSYTRFAYDDLHVSGGRTVSARFTVTNTGPVRGADVPQLYLTSAAGEPTLRLIGFERVELDPGERRSITLTADRRLLGWFDESQRRWRVKGGVYRVRLGRSAVDQPTGGEAVVAASNEETHGH